MFQALKGLEIMEDENLNGSIDYHKTNNRIDNLSNSIDRLCTTVDQFMNFANNTVPTNIVYIIFRMVFALIFGIEATQFLFTKFLPKFYGL